MIIAVRNWRATAYRVFLTVLVFVLILSMISVIHYDVLAQPNEEGISNKGIKSGNIYDYNAPLTPRAGDTLTFSLKPSWNLITLPVYNTSLTTAEQLADAIPCECVKRYNSSSQNWEMHERNKTDNNFQLENGTGYLVYLTSGKDFTMEGNGFPGVEIDLKKGWNSMGWYENNTTYPEKIMLDITNSTSVAYWDAILSRFVVHPKGTDMNNFSICKGMGLLVYTETNSVWDTLPTIISIVHDVASVLGPYDMFNVTLKGDKGYTASFDIGTAITGIAMTEGSPGVYKGSYTIAAGDPSGTYNVIGHLKSERYTDTMNAPTTVTIDTVAPAGINLAATPSTTSGTNVTLTWTAPGDDGTTGTASTYDIRYSSSIIDTDTKFNSATQCTGEPAPKAAGSSETFTVTGLTEGTTYYFAIKTGDEVPNWSPLSNSPNAKPSVAPAAITNLATSSPTQNSITLNWTAPGNDGNSGTASTYDIRYSTSIIDTDAKFNSATQCTGEPTPKASGSSESFTVTGLSASTTYYFAIKTADEVPNWSPISNSPSGTTSAPPDTILPNVTSTTPANSATSVAVTTTIVVQFSEAMNKANSEGAFSTSPATTGTFTWNAAGDKMTYTLSANLSYSTTYTITITPSATDLAGNPLDGDGDGIQDNPPSKDNYVFSFTTAAPPDTTAPAAITGLTATPSTTSGTNVTLIWTAPGDDGGTGTASTYDIRYSTSIIDTDTKFNSATQCTGEPAPKAAGGSETFTVTGLTEGTTYYFAIKSGDEVPNWSPLSNSPNAKPSVAPAAITNLATSSPTQNSITLSWTAPGDDGNTGTASSYDIRYYSSAITDSNWASATQCTGEPAPKSTGSAESFTVTSLSASTTYYFAIKTADAVPNWSPISNSPSGTTSALSDTILPNVTSTTPANSATGVAVTTTIVVQFSEAMNKANTEGAFSTSPATTGTFTWNAAGDKMTYTLSASLSYSTTYTVSITNSATDLAGNKLDGNGNGVVDNPASKDTYKFSFTTKAESDTTGPTVSGVAVNPATVTAGQTSTLTANVDDSTTGNSNIASAEWSKGASAASPGSGTAMSASDGTFNSPTEGVTATIDTTGWTAGTYTIWVRGKDASNNWGNAVSTTLTVNGADTTLPKVTSTTPANSATGVAVTTTIVVQFSEAMNKTNTQSAFSTNPATTGTFTWNVAGDTMTYTLSASLSGSTTYTVTITTAATDLAGNPLDGDGDGVQDAPNNDKYVFSFTTAGGGGTVNKYAVIVGISDYKAINDLSYCDEDASDWYNYLKGQGYTSWVYGDGHTANYPKYDGIANEYNVKQAIQNMIAQADSNDIIAYIDSGHGTKVAGKSVICMWDYGAGESGEDGMITNSELQALFNGVSVGGIFIFLDTCNSGGMNGVMSNANANIVYMATTCTATGYGYDDSTSKNGLWTEYFLNKGLVGGQSGHTDMEGNFQWAHDNYPKSGADEPQQFDGDTSKLFYLKPP